MREIVKKTIEVSSQLRKIVKKDRVAHFQYVHLTKQTERSSCRM